MNTRVLFVKRPVGWVDASCFRIEDCAEPECGPGDVLVEAIWLSLDPYLRGRMNEGPSYAPGFALGRPMVSRVVGSAGGANKVAFVRERCGFDAAFDYEARDLDEALAELCPRSIDVYFDNVGGRTLEAALRHAAVGARFPVCGMISTYNETSDAGIRGLQSLLSWRITMTGFIVYDHLHALAAYQQRAAPWIASGEIRFHEDIVHGIECAPAALIGMMKGEAIGKRLVQVADYEG